MRILIQNARIVQGDGISEPQDILVENGLIQRIGSGLASSGDAVLWSSPGICVSPGWLDVGTQTGDPGYEQREDIQTVLRAAAAGGFTAIAPFPNTSPAIHSKSEVLYLKNKATGHAVGLYPIAAISVDRKGKDLAELYDMHAVGALAFSDSPAPISDASLLLRALQYVQAFDGLVIDTPMNIQLAKGGQMHEGTISTEMGLKAIPGLAEEIALQRNLSLLEYSGGRIHLYGVSTAEGVELIRQAKAAGLRVTASTPVANVCYTEAQMAGFDSNWKVMPPLRSEHDRKALVQGLADGTIDCLSSNHTPLEEESKNVEFPYAEFGMSSLETALSMSCMHLLEDIDLPGLVKAWSVNPRKLLGLPIPEIAEGARADLTVFDPETEWTFDLSSIRSKGKNTPLLNQQLRGRAIGIISQGHMVGWGDG